MNPTHDSGHRVPEPTGHRLDSTQLTDIGRRFSDLLVSHDAVETYAQNELDSDRLPTDDGFAVWCARRAADDVVNDGYGVTDAGRALIAATAETIGARPASVTP